MMTTVTLTEFLLARFDEEEEKARDAAGWDRSGRERATGRWSRVGISSLEDDQQRSVIYSDNNQLSGSVADHVALHDPARVLADIKAKRQIVAAANRPGDPVGSAVMEFVLGRLATGYADHPDYRREWRP